MQERVAHWTKTVFLILSATKGMLAVNTSRPMDPPANGKKRWAKAGGGGVKLVHLNGGPVAPEHVAGIAWLPWLKRAAGGAKFREMAPGLYYGEIEELSGEAKAQHKRAPQPPGHEHEVYVIHGYAGWGGTQILAEIARGGWGLVPQEEYLKIRPDPALPFVFDLDLDWARIVPLAQHAPKSEYSRSKALT